MGGLPAPDRRDLLKRGLFLAGGAVGIGALHASPSLAQQSVVELPPEEGFPLYGARVHLAVDGKRSGSPPALGDRLLGFGDLLGQNAVKVGELYVTGTVFDAPLGGGPTALACVQQHTFSLAGGQIFGTAGCGLVPGVLTQFAVAGGTGQFAGALGTYASRLSPLGFGGDGTATFLFSFGIRVV